MLNRIRNSVILDAQKFQALRKSIKGFSNRTAFERSIVQIANLHGLREPSKGVVKNAESGHPIERAWLDVFARTLEVSLEIIESLIIIKNGNYTMRQCVESFLAWEQEKTNDEALVIKSIAIDMTDGWGNVIKVLDDCRSKQIQLDLAVMAYDLEIPQGPYSASIQAWAKNAKGSYDRMIYDLNHYTGSKAVRICVKHYDNLPDIHGARITKIHTRHYVTKCHPAGKTIQNFSWGDGNYWIVSGPQHDDEANEWAIKFDVTFANLWKYGRLVIDKVLIPAKT